MSVSPVILDTSGLKCPLPVLKARKAMRDVPPGGVLRVIATDPGAVKDFEHFCKTTGYHLLSQREEAGKLIFEIERTS
jgi:tRNA 2-thiouridine synthesizing protein A